MGHMGLIVRFASDRAAESGSKRPLHTPKSRISQQFHLPNMHEASAFLLAWHGKQRCPCMWAFFLVHGSGLLVPIRGALNPRAP